MAMDIRLNERREWYDGNGMKAICDLLVGCDGIRSIIRQQMFRDLANQHNDQMYLRYTDPVWTGTAVYRALIPASQLVNISNGEPHMASQKRMMVSQMFSAF